MRHSRFSTLFALLALSGPQSMAFIDIMTAFNRAQQLTQGPVQSWRQDKNGFTALPDRDARTRSNAGKMHTFAPPSHPARKKGYTQPRKFH
ncbi:hypothetical protein [Micavibrio aeruginosavorus]|nr:hypothetical protein [Micavibrio aeruginosavorus]